GSAPSSPTTQPHTPTPTRPATSTRPTSTKRTSTRPSPPRPARPAGTGTSTSWPDPTTRTCLPTSTASSPPSPPATAGDDRSGPPLPAHNFRQLHPTKQPTNPPTGRPEQTGDAMTANHQHTDATSGAVAVALRKALYRIPEAMELLSLSRTVIYEQIRAGR